MNRDAKLESRDELYIWWGLKSRRLERFCCNCKRYNCRQFVIVRFVFTSQKLFFHHILT